MRGLVLGGKNYINTKFYLFRPGPDFIRAIRIYTSQSEEKDVKLCAKLETSSKFNEKTLTFSFSLIVQIFKCLNTKEPAKQLTRATTWSIVVENTKK